MSANPIINAYLDDGGDEIVVVEALPDGGRKQRRIRAPYTTYHLASDISRGLMRALKNAEHVTHVVAETEKWIRIGWKNDGTRRQARYKFKDMGVDVYEGDVDPVMAWLVRTNAKIAKPRRCYLDLETDSRVPLSRKQDMRVLTWALTDASNGETFTGCLDEDSDDAEAFLLEQLVARLNGFDQICIWEGDWEGGEFDSFVFDNRVRRRGLGVDSRRWIWLNQLAVWKRMNMHSAESGAEKESFKLDDIAFEQLGRGKEKAPDFVVDRFGERAKKSLGALAWDLWSAGGAFRDLLVKYNARDALLLHELEQKKGFLTLFQAICEVCGIPPVTRSLQPTRQMDGYILRLGREHDHRFATKGFREDEEEQGQFKGAVVFKPKSIPHDADPDKGVEEWTAEQARAWRTENGFTNGILKNVHVCDFASLYPSVMRSYNLDGTTCIGWQNERDFKRDGLAPKTIRSPGTGLVTTSERKGYLPLAFETLVAKRKEWADLAASLPPGSPEWQDAFAISTAYKVTANSFYGGGASKYSRFNHRDASEACTQNGVHFLKLTKAEGEKRGMVLVYGDTDSNMVVGPSEAGFRSFVNWLNAKRFPAEVKSHGCIENHIKLAFEKSFERVVFVSAKAYVGRYSQYKGTPADRACHGLVRRWKEGVFTWYRGKSDVVAQSETCPECGGIGKLLGKPEIKGVAYKRGDKGKLARDLQGRIIDCLVGGVNVKDEHGKEHPINEGLDTPTDDLDTYRRIIESARHHVLAEPLPLDEVRLSKALNKSLRAYGKDNTDAHVRIARILEERGQQMGEGVRVEYVVVDGSKSPQVVIPAEDYTGECDRFYLWERVYQPSLALLEAAFPDENWQSYADVRPKKPRTRGKPVAEEQLGLGLGRAKTVPSDDFEELAVPAFSSKPLTVRVPESAGSEAIDRLAAVFKAHPGARAVEIVFVTKSGVEAVLDIPHRVSPSVKFREAVEQAIAPSASS